MSALGRWLHRQRQRTSVRRLWRGRLLLVASPSEAAGGYWLRIAGPVLRGGADFAPEAALIFLVGADRDVPLRWRPVVVREHRGAQTAFVAVVACGVGIGAQIRVAASWAPEGALDLADTLDPASNRT